MTTNQVRTVLPFRFPLCAAAWIGLFATTATTHATETESIDRFRQNVEPLLVRYCFDCHGDGSDKGQVAFDRFKSNSELLGDSNLWQAVIENTRSGVMPPEKKPRPTPEEQLQIEHWIKRDAFKIDPANPDPGRVTVRRLNRVEYRNTIRDLMGIDFRTDEEFPPDDTGYGFDNIGDVLTLSPLLLEKYMEAAESIVERAVPRAARTIPVRVVDGNAFKNGDESRSRFSFYENTQAEATADLAHSGQYRVELAVEIQGEFGFDPGKCRITLRLDDDKQIETELGWQNRKTLRFDFDADLAKGPHTLNFELAPLISEEEKRNSLNLRIVHVRFEGPRDQSLWTVTENYDRFFPRNPLPDDPSDRKNYAREVLTRFATQAFRRPVDNSTVDRLLNLVESAWDDPGKSFEDGVAEAMVPVLASPRFLFRLEHVSDTEVAGKFATLDDYALASRLSYFLWSTLPDQRLLELAGRGELGANLNAEAKRMLADPRSNEFVNNFVGQWLQARDIDGIDINARTVLARDAGTDREMERVRDRFRELRAIPDDQLTPAQETELEEVRAVFRNRSRQPAIELDRELRQAMRAETEMHFGYLAREDRSLLELIDSDYTFLNERLARHYGIEDVRGGDMRRVSLPAGSPRGGILTQGTVLVVTSNPTRTSPVKRGLFLLDNILGTPPPPPPDDVPDLEAAEEVLKDQNPTLREALELHRNKPLCSSCHSRMDPLGLALENFNALGLWRDEERKQPINPAAQLITGESFKNVRELKRILATDRRLDFYRCLTGKLLTYALGRGLDYYDLETVDQIVEQLDKEGGRFSVLLNGIVDSAPFRKRRIQTRPETNL